MQAFFQFSVLLPKILFDLVQLDKNKEP